MRHLLSKAVVDARRGDGVPRARRATSTAGTAAPEWDFGSASTTVRLRTIRASVPVPAEILADPAALAAFVDFRLLVRLGTAENDVLLNGEGGLLRIPGLRRHEPSAAPPADRLLETAALCEWYGGSADGIVHAPRRLVAAGAEGPLLERLATQGVKVSRTRMIPAGHGARRRLHRRRDAARPAQPPPSGWWATACWPRRSARGWPSTSPATSCSRRCAGN